MASVKTPRRPGLSLTEVLVAIFVMGIGMISLLVLFPVGLSNMHWAMRDSKLTLASQVALANAEAVHQDANGQPFTLRSDPNYLAMARWTFDPAPTNNGVFRWYPVPLGGFPAVGSLVEAPSVPTYDPNGSRPPVYVDSIGTLSFPNIAANGGSNGLNEDPARGTSSNWGFAVGARPTCAGDHDRLSPSFMTAQMRPFLYGIPRIRSLNLMGAADAMRACTQEDEIAFARNGQPEDNGAGNVNRANQYSWAYMCRFPKGTDPNVVDMTIVLYSGRRTTSTLPTNSKTSGEVRFFGNPSFNHLVFIRGSSQAVVEVYDWRTGWTGNGLPASAPVASPFQKGGIILDNTVVMPDFFTYTPAGPGMPPARYYAPFATQYTPTPTVPVPVRAGYNPPPAGLAIRSGLANGYFYKILAVGPVKELPVGSGRYVQTLMLDRPALADGFEAVYLENAVDIIEKSNGRMPGR